MELRRSFKQLIERRERHLHAAKNPRYIRSATFASAIPASLSMTLGDSQKAKRTQTTQFFQKTFID
jgi:hypothetical protein